MNSSTYAHHCTARWPLSDAPGLVGTRYREHLSHPGSCGCVRMRCSIYADLWEYTFNASYTPGIDVFGVISSPFLALAVLIAKTFPRKRVSGPYGMILPSGSEKLISPFEPTIIPYRIEAGRNFPPAQFKFLRKS